jgi:hypothetical protein
MAGLRAGGVVRYEILEYGSDSKWESAMATTIAKGRQSKPSPFAQQASAVRRFVWRELEPMKAMLLTHNFQTDFAVDSKRTSAWKPASKKTAQKKLVSKKVASKKAEHKKAVSKKMAKRSR